MEFNFFNIKISVTKIQIAAIISVLTGIYIIFVLNSMAGLGSILVAVILLYKTEEEVTMPDPIKHREEQLKTPTGKQLGLPSMSDIKSQDIEFELLEHPDREEAINVFYIQSKGGFVDVEVHDAYNRPGKTALKARYNHVVEARSIGVFRSNIRRNFMNYGTKGALNYLKRQGFNSDMLSSAFDTKKNKKKKDDSNEE